MSTAASQVRFRTTLRQSGKTATGIEVPPDAVECLGAGKRPPVRVTIHGYTYRSTVAVMGGAFMVGVSAANRQGAGVAAGDEVDVDLELDTQPREVAIPPDLAKALAAEPEAKKRFEALSNSRKPGYTLPIEAAKAPETRQRRIAKTILELNGQ